MENRTQDIIDGWAQSRQAVVETFIEENGLTPEQCHIVKQRDNEWIAMKGRWECREELPKLNVRSETDGSK